MSELLVLKMIGPGRRMAFVISFPVKMKPYESPIIPFENFFRPVVVQMHGRSERILTNARTQPQLNVANQV